MVNTGDEVKEMLDGLCGVLKADLSSELMHNSHTSTLLLLQMFQQAEKWHLKLQLDLSEMESGWVWSVTHSNQTTAGMFL